VGFFYGQKSAWRRLYHSGCVLSSVFLRHLTLSSAGLLSSQRNLLETPPNLSKPQRNLSKPSRLLSKPTRFLSYYEAKGTESHSGCARSSCNMKFIFRRQRRSAPVRKLSVFSTCTRAACASSKALIDPSPPWYYTIAG
jgi:hypothetical protein